jgi:hypothetical protein
MLQQGQVFELTTRGRDGERLWAYRFRVGGRRSSRIQRGGFVSEPDAREALERELERVRRERRIPRSLTLSELVETYLSQHDVQQVTIDKLRWLLAKATAVFGERRIGELTSQEIAAWRMTLSPGYRFEATQALRQVLHRAVVWNMIDINPAKVGVDNPTPRRKEQRPIRVLGGARSHCRGARSALRADDHFRRGDRAPPGGVDRARETRHQPCRTRGLRPPLVHEARAQASKDRSKSTSGAAANQSDRRRRTATC